jgi:hypothetical protein
LSGICCKQKIARINFQLGSKMINIRSPKEACILKGLSYHKIPVHKMNLCDLSTDALSEILKYLGSTPICGKQKDAYRKNGRALKHMPYIKPVFIMDAFLMLDQDDVMALIWCLNKKLCAKISSAIQCISIYEQNFALAFQISKNSPKLRTLSCYVGFDLIMPILGPRHSLTNLHINVKSKMTETFDLPPNLTRLSIINARLMAFQTIPLGLKYINVENIHESEFNLLPETLTKLKFDFVTQDNSTYLPEMRLPNLRSVCVRNRSFWDLDIKLFEKSTTYVLPRTYLDNQMACHLIQNLPPTLKSMKMHVSCELNLHGVVLPTCLEKLDLVVNSRTIIKLDVLPRSLKRLIINTDNIDFGADSDDLNSGDLLNMLANHLYLLSYLDISASVELDYISREHMDSLPPNLIEIHGASDPMSYGACSTRAIRTDGVWHYS